MADTGSSDTRRGEPMTELVVPERNKPSAIETEQALSPDRRLGQARLMGWPWPATDELASRPVGAPTRGRVPARICDGEHRLKQRT
jgi:hypothetical protein